jgi:hypothetical protein
MRLSQDDDLLLFAGDSPAAHVCLDEIEPML